MQPGWGSQWSTPDLHGGSEAFWTVYIGWDIKCYPARNLFDPSGMHGTGLGSQQFHPRSIFVDFNNILQWMCLFVVILFDII